MNYTEDQVYDINERAFGDRYKGQVGIILGEDGPDTVEEAMAEFERDGSIYGAWFTFGGSPWEDPDDVSTWGPEPH